MVTTDWISVCKLYHNLFSFSIVRWQKGDLNMTKQRKTSAKIASKASSLLKDGRTSAKTKSVAGSALSQRAPKKK